MQNKPVRDPRLRTRQVTPQLLEYIVNKIVVDINPRQIILFGSRARGDFNNLSDLDLFIVQDSGATNREVRRRIEQLLWGRQFGVDLLVRKPEEVERNLADGNPFYTRHIFKEGRILYGRPS